MEPRKKDILKWIDALRSGEYTQGKEKLQSTFGYCCLGVACKVFIPEDKLSLGIIEKTLLGAYPADQKHAPKWLKEINSDFSAIAGTPLSTLNDVEDFTFDMIADVLYMVYILKILD